MDIAIAILSIIFAVIGFQNFGLKKKLDKVKREGNENAIDAKQKDLELRALKIKQDVDSLSLTDLVNRKRE